MRQTDTEGGQYSVAAVLSDDRMTKWAPSKSSGGGIGEWIQLDGYGTQHVRGINILNGYHKNQQAWLNNNRVAMCAITFSNGESFDVTLDDTMGMITVDFGRYVETASIRLTIKSLYPGAKWNDTAIHIYRSIVKLCRFMRRNGAWYGKKQNIDAAKLSGVHISV